MSAVFCAPMFSAQEERTPYVVVLGERGDGMTWTIDVVQRSEPERS